MSKENSITTSNFCKVITFLLLVVNFSLPCYSVDSDYYPEINQQVQAPPSDASKFGAPVALLVGLSGSELSYRELSALSGFELFTVPYKTDIKTLVEQVKPTQVIIKHPSGFVGLYSVDGQLIRGIQTAYGPEVANYPGAVPPSIVQPTEANPVYENVYYPGALTGAVPHGGLGYTPPPKGRGVLRHLLKIASLAGLTPFQYPGYFMAYGTYNQEKLFPALVFPNVPLAIGAASTYADAKLDNAEYENARSQPRDYMFQPVIEGY